MNKEISIIGAGLAGCEAALFLAHRGWKVQLFEMRPETQTPAHNTGLPAELVCSNSLKSMRLDTASGLLKAELEALGCELLPLAKAAMVPAGQALAVDRDLFSQKVADALQNCPGISLIRKEIQELPISLSILASGPLSSNNLMAELRQHLGAEQLYFFDAIAPIVDASSIDYDKVYSKDRYDKGEPDYINCPFTKDEYYSFVDALIAAEKHEAHEFENEFFSSVKFSFYENCIPIEEIARRGIDSLRHGVMKPMGLEDPRTGKKPWAVLQLRAENNSRSSFNLVGCQTMLRYPEQKRVFRMIPGLDQAEFHRLGSIHRNSYLNSPEVLSPDLSLKSLPHVFVAGQLSGVEGYVESIGSGTLVARIIDQRFGNPEPASVGGLASATTVGSDANPSTNSGTPLPPETILGQLWRHITTPAEGKFQPMNANFGILPPLEDAPRDKKLKKELYSSRSLASLKRWLEADKR